MKECLWLGTIGQTEVTNLILSYLCLPTYLPAGLPVCLPACLPACLIAYLSVCLSACLPACFSLCVCLCVLMPSCVRSALFPSYLHLLISSYLRIFSLSLFVSVYTCRTISLLITLSSDYFLLSPLLSLFISFTLYLYYLPGLLVTLLEMAFGGNTHTHMYIVTMH